MASANFVTTNAGGTQYLGGVTSTNSTTLTVSFFMKCTGFNDGRKIFTGGDTAFAGASSFSISQGSDIHGIGLNIQIGATTASNIADPRVVGLDDGNWHWYAVSLSLSGTTVTLQTCIDGNIVAPFTGGRPTNTSGVTAWDLSTTSLGIAAFAPAGTNGLISTSLSEIWIDRTAAMDFSVPANRAKFWGQYTTENRTVRHASDGSDVTGSQPIIYLNFPAGNPQTNAGSAGNFTNHSLTTLTSGGPNYADPPCIGAMTLPILQASGNMYQSGAFISLPLLQPAGIVNNPPTAAGAFSLPLLQLAASGITPPVATGTMQLPLLNMVGVASSNLDAAGNPIVNTFTGSLRLPLLRTAGNVVAGITYDANISLPLLGVAGNINGAQARFSLPLLGVAGTLVNGQVALGAVRLPLLGVAAALSDSRIITASLALPILQVHGSSITGGISRGSMRLPLLQVKGAGYSGRVGTASFHLPLLHVAGQAYTNGQPNARFNFPLLQIASRVYSTPAQTFRGWALNSSKGYITEYVNLPVTSMTVVNNLIYATTSAGIIVLDPASVLDGSTAIDAYVESRLDNYDDSRFKRLPRAYVSTEQEANLQFHVLTKTTGTHKYLLPFNGNTSLFQRRVKVGKGLRDVYFGFGIKNVGGGDFSLHKVVLNPVADPRRVY